MGSRSAALCLLATVVALTSLTMPAAGAPDPAPTSPWLRPVPGAVAEPFVAPRSKYGPGHRGVDFVAAPGTPVRVAREGVVAFAGSVAGSLHVVVDHGDGFTTSYSFLA